LKLLLISVIGTK